MEFMASQKLNILVTSAKALKIGINAVKMIILTENKWCAILNRHLYDSN